MAQLSSARLQADVGVAEIANIYLNDPLLKTFTVPRLVIGDATVNLQLAVDKVKVGAQAITSLANGLQPVLKQTLTQFLQLNASSVLNGVNVNQFALDASNRILLSDLASLDNTTFILLQVQSALTAQVASNATTSFKYAVFPFCFACIVAVAVMMAIFWNLLPSVQDPVQVGG
jgi:hypothetical protein